MRARANRRFWLAVLAASSTAAVLLACSNSGFSVSAPEDAAVALVDAMGPSPEDAAEPVRTDGGPPVVIVPPDASSLACPEGYSSYADEDGKAHCLQLVSENISGVAPLTFSGARSACAGRGDHLVTMTSLAEVRQVYVYVMDKDKSLIAPWIGLRAPAGTMKGTDGMYPKDAFRWVDEPDAAALFVPNQWVGDLTDLCVALDMSAAKFRTADCATLRAFVCEREL